MVEHVSFDRLTGTTLGSYRLEQLVEQSEAGPVFMARSHTMETAYRLRILAIPPDLTPEDRIVYLGHFKQEANHVATLQHTTILPLIDYGTHSASGDPRQLSLPYLVYPYVPMRSVSAQLAQNGPMDPLLASRCLDQIAAALEHAHQYTILHRNLSTDCIFIKQDGKLLVADFGLLHMLEVGARFIAPAQQRLIPSEAEKAEKKAINQVLYWMSKASAPAPEQILGQPVDTYTDVYALGAALYRMLTGHRVFRGKTREEIARQHLQAPVPSLSVWRSDLPTELDAVLARAMAKDPSQRFRQPGALANAYHQVIAPADTSRKAFAIDTSSARTDQSTNRAQLSAAERVSILRPQQPRISRRRALSFLAAGGGTAAAIIAVAAFGSRYLVGNTSPTNTSSANTAVATTTVSSSNRQGAHVLARTSDIPVNSAKTFPISGHNNPGLLIHLSNGRFVAFDSTCTHTGCAVSYNQQAKLLECPCHGAVFDPARNAAVVQGPAPSPLTPINISVNTNGTITDG